MWETQIRRIVVGSQPRQKVNETLSEQTSQVWTFNASSEGDIGRRIAVPGWSEK
jgi:hypothetical protein